MPQTLDHLARDLRAAVLASDHEHAMRLATHYTEAVRQHWVLLSTRERAASPLSKQSLELLQWVRDMTLMQHALANQHLTMLEKSSRYQYARAVYLQSAALGHSR